MANDFKEMIKHRRSYYSISNASLVPDREIEEILEFAIKFLPSAFNSQTTRLVLLFGKEHKKLWDIVKETLKKRISAEAFVKTENKIDSCFACGYGTVLFFEDNSIVRQLQEGSPLYKDRFPVWAEHTSAMHQLIIWTMLEDLGFGASLQHYNPLIDDEVLETWNLPRDWNLIAQMPFGLPVDKPEEKEHTPINDRVFVFKS